MLYTRPAGGDPGRGRSCNRPKVRFEIGRRADAGAGPAPYRWIMRESLDGRALSAVSDAVLTIAAERSFQPVLEKLVDAARELADARYTAIGVPDDEGGSPTSSRRA
jgi:hypothetical protein